MTTTTTKNLTDQQISKLRTEATEAGDFAMGAICDLALKGTFDADDYTCLSRTEAVEISGMSRDEAYAKVAEALNSAAAMAD